MGSASSHDQHHRRLENAYHAAVIHELVPMRLEVADGTARVHFTATPEFHHAARATHGSLCFKMLDDAAFFAVASREPERFWPTARFEVEYVRPVTTGVLVAEGRIVRMDDRRADAEAEVRDGAGHVMARGRGTFVRGRARWSEADGY